MVRFQNQEAAKNAGRYSVMVVQCCVGKFHHFDLARQLHDRGMLEAIFSGYPRWKLRQEAVPDKKIITFPWFQSIYMGKSRLGLNGSWLDRELAWLSRETFDKYCAAKLPPCDVLIGLSGFALRAGRAVQARGARFKCDRGS